MEPVFNFLKGSATFYLATLEGDQPRVRPFGAIAMYDGRLYINTNNKKEVFHQLLSHSKIEICAMNSNGLWMRITAKAILDSRIEARQQMLEQNPYLKSQHTADDGLMEVFYLDEGVAVLYSFTDDPITITF